MVRVNVPAHTVLAATAISGAGKQPAKVETVMAASAAGLAAEAASLHWRPLACAVHVGLEWRMAVGTPTGAPGGDWACHPFKQRRVTSDATTEAADPAQEGVE